MKITLSLILIISALNFSFAQTDSSKESDTDTLYCRSERTGTSIMLNNRLRMFRINPTPVSVPQSGLYTRTSPRSFGYGIPWPNVIYETIESNGIIIQNSLPKGGGYTDPDGKPFGYRIFWSRVVNDTDTPIELTISFPAAISPLPDSYLKLFLPSDTMAINKIMLYDYGATGLKSFLDAGLDNPTMLKKTINPKEDYMFYVGALFNNGYGVARTALTLNGQNLFYKVSGIGPEVESAMIPSGKIVIKK